MPQPATYDITSRINHWAIALAVIVVLCIGLYLGNFDGDRALRGSLRDFHKATGVLILVFGAWRVLWRLFQGFPAAVATLPGWQMTAAKITHWVLLAAVIVMPISGLLKTLFAGYPVSVYGIFSIPAPEKVEWIRDLAGQVHGIGGWVLLVALLLHVGGAMKHHFIARDATLVRMLTGRSTRS